MNLRLKVAAPLMLLLAVSVSSVHAAALNFLATPEITHSAVILAANNSPTNAPKANYTCSGLECTCTGDADCNDMFSSGKCGDISSCETTTGVCKCLIVKKNRPAKVKPGTGGSGLKKQ